MAKPPVATAGAAAEVKTRKARTPRVLSQIESELIANAKTQMEAAKNVAKEAKQLGKLIGVIPNLSAWAVGKVKDAVVAREEALAATAAAE